MNFPSMFPPPSRPLVEILNAKCRIDVVDIGANPIDEEPPYSVLLDKGIANVVGFEPNEQAFERLNAKKGPSESYLPLAVYDGGCHTFHFCSSQGMSSILKPNMNLLKLVHGFGEWARVIETQEVDTVRFDDISEISNVDYLKIDTQGSELTIFENGPQKLSECAVIHTEVEFVPMYEEQPLFAEVDQYLRSLGFVLHRFCSMGSRALKPLTLHQSAYSPFSQVLWTDAVYVKDFMKLVDLPPGKLLAMAIILHDIYRSYDLVFNILSAHDALANTSYAETFISALGLSITNS